MRSPVVPTLCAAMIAAGSTVGCQQAPTVVAPPRAAAPTEAIAPGSGRHAQFSADRAWDHLRALSQIGPRVIDTPGSAEARDYIRAQLEKLNLEVDIDEHDWLARPESESDVANPEDGDAGGAESEFDGASLFTRNISASIPGQQSSGSIMLMAPYDTEAFDDFVFVGANDGGSGAAVLLELSRVIASDPLPYTTEIVFVDGHAPFGIPGRTQGRQVGAGIAQLALARKGQDHSDVHLVVYLNRIGDADLHIVRDLLSHRVYREEFFDAARRVGQTAAFEQDAPFESTGLKYRALSAVGLRRIVSIVDTAYGGEEPPGLYAGTEQDTMDRCSPESLGSVGGVVLEGLEAISKWVMKIERFSQLPLDRSPEAEPDAEQHGDEAQQ